MARALLRWPALLLASVFGLVGCSRAGLAEGPPAAPPDLILITIDTLRADAPSFAGVHPGTTPNLDRLAAKGRVFDNAHAHNVITLPSHTNILTGLYPYQHGVRENSGFKLRRDVPTLATYLKAAGYKTAAFVGAYPLDSEFGLDRGFDVYDDRFPKGSRPTEFVLPERRGDEVVRLALAWWQQQKGSRRFLWVHLFDPHAPYDPPEPFASKFAKEPYLGDVAAADSFLAPLLSPHLEGKEPPALIVVTGDHGEGLGEHGELTHGLFAYEPTLHVPLLLWGVGVPPGRDPRPARHVDILPTLLGAAGVKPPTAGASRLPGASLLGPAPSGLAADSYFESLSASLNRGWAPLRGVIRDGKKAILLPLPELYDLPRDPREASNLFDAERRLAATLLRSLPTESEWPPPRGAISEEEARRLAALGYITSTASTKPSFDVKDDPKRLVDLDRKIHDLVDLYSRGRLEEAVKLGEEVVKERPEMPLGYSLLAQALLEKGDTAAAVKLMQEARKGGRATESLLVQLGLSLAELGRAQEAIEVLEGPAGHGNLEAGNALAQTLSEAGQQEAARETLAKLLAADPEQPKTYENLGLVALRQGRWLEARDQSKKALELNPGLPLSWNNLGVALYRLGQPEPALDAWAKAVELDPKLYDALFNLGFKAAEHGRTAQARKALEQFIASAPRDRYGPDIREAQGLLGQLRAKG